MSDKGVWWKNARFGMEHPSTFMPVRFSLHSAHLSLTPSGGIHTITSPYASHVHILHQVEVAFHGLSSTCVGEDKVVVYQ
jgi:hypothetical protein